MVAETDLDVVAPHLVQAVQLSSQCHWDYLNSHCFSMSVAHDNRGVDLLVSVLRPGVFESNNVDNAIPVTKLSGPIMIYMFDKTCWEVRKVYFSTCLENKRISQVAIIITIM